MSESSHPVEFVSLGRSAEFADGTSGRSAPEVAADVVPTGGAYGNASSKAADSIDAADVINSADSIEAGAASIRAAQIGSPHNVASPDDIEPTDVGESSHLEGVTARRLLAGPRKGRRLVRPEDSPRTAFTPPQRLLILDSWQRSGLPAGDFAPLVGLSKHTLYAWKKQFEELGPAGLMDQPRGARGGSRVPEVTKRTILLYAVDLLGPKPIGRPPKTSDEPPAAELKQQLHDLKQQLLAAELRAKLAEAGVLRPGRKKRGRRPWRRPPSRCRRSSHLVGAREARS